jgi:hypothetical protein
VTGQPPWLHNAIVRIGLHCCDGGEVAGGHAFEVEDWDQHFEAFRAPRIGRQNRRRKADSLGTLVRPAQNLKMRRLYASGSASFQSTA